MNPVRWVEEALTYTDGRIRWSRVATVALFLGIAAALLLLIPLRAWLGVGESFAVQGAIALACVLFAHLLVVSFARLPRLLRRLFQRA